MQVDVVGAGGQHGADFFHGGGGDGGSGAHVTALIPVTPGTTYQAMVGDVLEENGGGAPGAGGASGISDDPNCGASNWLIMAGGGGGGSDGILGNGGARGGDGCLVIQHPGFPGDGTACTQASNGNNNHLVTPSGAGGAGGNGTATAGGGGGGGGHAPALAEGNGGSAGTFLAGGNSGDTNATIQSYGGGGGGGYYGGGGGGGNAEGATGGGGGGGSSVVLTATMTTPYIYPAGNGLTGSSSDQSYGSVTFTPVTATTTIANLSAAAGTAAVPVSAQVSTSSTMTDALGGSVRFDVVDPTGSVVATAGPLALSATGMASGDLDASAVPAGVYSIVATYLYGGQAIGTGSAVLYLTNPGVSVSNITSVQATPFNAADFTVPPATTVQVAISSGTATATVANYSGDPVATGLQSGDQFFDLHLSSSSNVQQVNIIRCDTDQYSFYWWNGTAWVLAQDQSPQPETINNQQVTCAFLRLNSSSTPTLAQLTGTPFGMGATPTAVSDVTAPSVAYDHSTTLTATVSPANGVYPVPDAGLNGTVEFTAGSTDLGSVPVTSSAGAASVTASLTLKAAPPAVPSGGQYPVVATFTPSGDQYLGSASAPVTWTITQSNDTLTYTGSVVLGRGLTETLSAVLKEDGLLPVSGRTISFTAGTQHCSGVTNAAGVAQCAITVAASQPYGPGGQVSASFAGDADYVPATATTPDMVFAFPAGGAFAVGDVSAGSPSSQAIAAGDTVTFWGAQWAKANVLSGGSAPSEFKGFAPGSAPPACGSTWSANPGASTPAPAAPLPPYMGVIVTSQASKSGSAITGDTVHIVVVATKSGYTGDPGTPGTGTIVATYC
jgi:hypothetical protein